MLPLPIHAAKAGKKQRVAGTLFTFADLPGLTTRTARSVRYRALLDPSPPLKLWVATGQPGYDDTLLGQERSLTQDRANGALYRATLDAAIATHPDLLVITSRNEWCENTHIEPSEAFGDAYLYITKEAVDRWRSC